MLDHRALQKAALPADAFSGADHMTCSSPLLIGMLHRRDAAGQDNPLQLGMTTELLADSFLKALFTRFYHMLQSHGLIAHKGLQV